MALELPNVLLREGLVQLLTAAGPFLVGLLVVGLVVGVLQAMTQVHDAAVGFLPRLLTVILLITLVGGSVVDRLAAFFASSVVRMAGG